MTSSRVGLDEGSLLWTLEEIGRLVSQSGNPSETLDERRPSDSAAVRHRRLLGLPARARPREPGARRDDRPAARERRPRADAADRGPGGPGRRAAASRRSSPTRRRTRASSTSARPARILSLVPRRADHRSRRCSRASWSSRPPSRATFTPDDVRHAGRRPARSSAPIVSEARTLGQFVAPRTSACDARPEPVVELGQRHDEPVPRARPGPVARAATTTRSRCCSRSRSTQLEERALAAGAAQPHQLRLPAACRSTCSSTHTWGARHAGVLWARPVAYFSAEFGLHESLPIYSGGLGILAGDHIKSASDLGIPLVGVGLFYDQGYFRQRLDATAGSTRTTSTSTAGCCRSSRRSARRHAGHRHDRDAHRHDHGARLAAGRRPEHAAAARLERRGQPARGPRAHRAALRRRRPRPHPPGAAARRRRRAGAGRAGHLARRRAPERGAQRVRRAGDDPRSGWTTEGIDA